MSWAKYLEQNWEKNWRAKEKFDIYFCVFIDCYFVTVSFLEGRLGTSIHPNFSDDLPETLRKLCLSPKFSDQEISWNIGILRKESHCIMIKGKFRTLSNINDGNIVRKLSTAKRRYPSLKKALRRSLFPCFPVLTINYSGSILQQY